MMADSQVSLANHRVRCLDKTPIQILHEYGIKIGSAPTYELLRADGDAHQPCFMFSVTIGEITCTGEGSTKKAAKHEAAEASIKLLKLDTQPNDRRENNGLASEVGDVANPVGILQELAMQRVWCLPEYMVCLESGPDHMKEFTVSCRLEGLEETGTGSSKKLARRAAAERMLGKLQSLSGSPEITWSPPSRVYIESLRHSTGEKISVLKRTPLSIPNTDYIQLLLELSLEQGFQVTYMAIVKMESIWGPDPECGDLRSGGNTNFIQSEAVFPLMRRNLHKATPNARVALAPRCCQFYNPPHELDARLP